MGEGGVVVSKWWDLIYILKVLFWLLSGEWVIGEQSEAWRQIRRRSQVRDDDGVEQGGYQWKW